MRVWIRLVWLLSGLLFMLASSMTRAPAAPVGSEAPPIGGTDLYGEHHRLADLNAPVKVLYFFRAAPKCIEELKVLKRLQDEAAGQMRVLAVFTDEADRQPLQNHFQGSDPGFPVIFADEGQVGAYRAGVVTFTTATFVIRDSDVAAIRPGFTSDLEPFLREKAMPPPDGSIGITTDPPGCQVRLDGNLRADKTPTTIPGVKPGTYTLGLSLDGYEQWEHKNVIVKAGETTPVKATLREVLFPPENLAAPRTWTGVIPAPVEGLVTCLMRPPHASRLIKDAKHPLKVTVDGTEYLEAQGMRMPHGNEYAIRDGVFEFPGSSAGKTATFEYHCRLARAVLHLKGVGPEQYERTQLAKAVNYVFAQNAYAPMPVTRTGEVAPDIQRGLLVRSGKDLAEPLGKLGVEELVEVSWYREGGQMAGRVSGPEGLLWDSEHYSRDEPVSVTSAEFSDERVLRSAVATLFRPWFSR